MVAMVFFVFFCFLRYFSKNMKLQDMFNDVLIDVLNMKMAHWQSGMVRFLASFRK